MMYVSIYPIAMRYVFLVIKGRMRAHPAYSVRSTNVYEEKSLGVFRDDESVDEEDFTPTGNRATIWSRYLAMHMRKQLSFGKYMYYSG